MLQACNMSPAMHRQTAFGSATATTPQASPLRLRAACCSLQHPVRGKLARFVCNANDRTAAPNAAEAPSPDGTAVLENSQQFKVHLLAAIEDPRVKDQNEVTPEVKSLVEELKSVSPKDRKKVTMDGIKGTFRGVLSDIDRMTQDGITSLGTMSFQQFKPTETTVKASGTTLKIGIDYDSQYQVDIPMTIQDGPLAGIQALQSTIGQYTVDDNEPTKQKIDFTALALQLNTSDSAAKQKWLDVMRKENDKMDEEGKINLTFPQPMKGFRDFLFFDEQLQISIGNRGSLTIIKQ